MSTTHIYLDNARYYPGNTITGKAVCFFRTRKEIRKIRIRLKGNESTHWTGTESYYDSSDRKHKTRTVHYSGDRDFLLKDLIVHGEGTISEGEHVFPFQFVLPDDLPASFHHSYGQIVFSVKVTVDRPWKADFEEKKIFTMISPIKLLRLSPSLQQPAEYSDEKTICCFCCASGPVQLDLNLNKRAFVVGEAVGMKVYIMNMSNTNVESLSVSMKMKLRMKTTSPKTDYKYDSESIFSSHNSGVGAHGDKTYNLSIDIPATTVVPNFTGCELFSCDHQLKVSATISGCHSDLDIGTDVALGHIPYPQVPLSAAQYLEAVPPYPADQPIIDLPEPVTFQPMPMPLPGYEDATQRAVGVPPYPVPGYSPTGASAPQEFGAPSAPPKLDFWGNNMSGPGNTSANESPPPTYDEAAKNFK